MTKDNEQLSFDTTVDKTDDEPVVCLGMTFKNEEDRREYFRNELRKKLPELKEIEGFPIGEDEDIIALSDPPYYTACPNPWINDFIEEWEKEKVEKYGRDPEEEYKSEPFVADVSEGKRDPIYTVHSYHTKVPYKAIMRYILHYTRPGDIVLDGFSGTGMTGIAGNKCGSEDEIRGLGYYLDENGNIKHSSNDDNGSKLGKRRVIMNDLSPFATSLSEVLNSNINTKKFVANAKQILEDIQKRYLWLFQTNHYDGESIRTCNVNYFVWSDVFLCNNCSSELVFYDVATDKETGKVKREFTCPDCKIITNKRLLERVKVTYFDQFLGDIKTVSKQKLVLINYSYLGKRYNKLPDDEDLLLLNKIDSFKKEEFGWFPVQKLPMGHNTSQPKRSHGLTYVHQFYSRRVLFILSKIYEQIMDSDMKKELLPWFTSHLINLSMLNRYRPEVTFPYNPLNGTLYIGSQINESNVFTAYSNKIKNFERAFNEKITKNTVISCNSTTSLNLTEDSVDYIFTDPPFGANIMYSELSFIWESWLKVKTNNKKETIINTAQKKGLIEYQYLMEKSFINYYKFLKPGRWITVEFSNSKASIWNSIQEVLQKVGFIIANVSVLDKKQGSFKAVTSPIAVKQDLIISAYKPLKENIEELFQTENSEHTAWIFIKQHLKQLPIYIGEKGIAETISERTPRILFDRMVAFHVQNTLPVPISSAEFQEEIAQRFPMRDGMVFLENQVAEYDKKRILVKEFSQQSLFVSDENSAIEWIRQQLMNKPQTRQDIHPNFMKEIQHIARHEILPELDDLLNENFLQYEGDGEVPSQITTYLRRNYKDLRGLEADHPDVVAKAMNRWYVPDPRKQGDLERLRERALLREFEGYLAELEGNKRKLRQFRTEAVRAGFKKAYSERDFKKIVEVGDRLPEKIIQEDDKLLMYYDNAYMLVDM